VALFDFSGGHEMKDKSSRDDYPNGNDPTPPPIRNNAKGKYHQASQQSDFDKDQRHGLPLPCEAYAKHWTTRMPRGPKGEKRPADATGNAVMIAKIATGEIEDKSRWDK
jgi:hypothetical protein